MFFYTTFGKEVKEKTEIYQLHGKKTGQKYWKVVIFITHRAREGGVW